MKKLLLILATATLAVNMSVAQAAMFGTKVAIFDLHQVLKSDSQVVAAQANLKQQFAPDGKKIITAKKALQNDIQTYNKYKNKNSSAAKKLALKVNKESDKLANTQATFQRKLMVAQNQALKDVLDKVKTATKQVAKQDGYDLVFTKSNVAYNCDKVDITQQVIAAMKKATS